MERIYEVEEKRTSLVTVTVIKRGCIVWTYS